MFKICFLFDKKNLWLKNFFLKKKFKNNNLLRYKFSENYKNIKNFDIVFILGYTKLLSKNFLEKNKLSLVVHESNLPYGKGFAPVQWQILKGQTNIPMCLIKAEINADSGDIYEKIYFKVSHTDLYDQIRKKQAAATIKIIKKFLKKYPKIKAKKQKGKGTFLKKRKKSDSKLDINKSIKEQFNLLRICNNNKWPGYFIYKKKKYIIKIMSE